MSIAIEHAQAEQQYAIYADAPLFVQACPGAGKTHVIVSRHLQRPAGALRSGRALVSFTRTARDQMKARCITEGHPELAQFPHYIGTLDGFIWHFLVSPFLKLPQPPQLLESWAQLARAEVKLGTRAVALSAFTFTLDPDTLREDVVKPGKNSSAGRTVSDSPYSWTRWKQAVHQYRDQWRERGYFTGHEARLYAMRYLRADPHSVTVPLRSRFTEVIVDEAQDCSITDLAILEVLRTHGVPLVLVADPDQAIYGWNQADPTRLLNMRNMLGSRATLTGNRRSAPPICALATTLRTGNRPPDTSVVRTTGPAVHLIPTAFGNAGKAVHSRTGQDLVELAVELADRHHESEITSPSMLVLARKHTQLPPAHRRAEPDSNTITRLARAYQCLQSGTTQAAELDQACQQAEQILLGYWYPEQTGSVTRICRTVGLSPAALRRHAYAFLKGLPTPSSTWAGEVNARIKAWWRPSGAAPAGGKGLLRSKIASIGQRAPRHPTARLTTVHQAKGDEADAVCVLLPDDDLITRWRTGNVATAAEQEELRVLYVAVTRARTLLILAVREESIAALQDFLDRHQVPTHMCR
ncbi:UvrD-helicase domain-containing protein [Nocardia cyriacigeorgica]|uniref:DNA 3'-5' helicase n=1 Tax=Nocardia cyriacigeorgica TaxID=135487 RepID=A0A5R8PDK1_9NOCA|nr:ATP-dependent helicase [Nocardia cyriacigeorgica]MBF6095761.1 ATP-dependent helicase [Nocardia cyriacigeorgica]TLF73636.1 ATP-dependent helicase [Nocardia cyriacigeorgica]TLG10273.1 ATP-dependent helicase [Nocardia cyriacigeorgica]